MTTTDIEELVELDDADVLDETDEAPRSTPPRRSAPVRTREVVTAPAGATGRRKEAIARVRIVPGTGRWIDQRAHAGELLPEQGPPAAGQRPVPHLRPRRSLRRHRPHLGWRHLGSGRRASPRRGPLPQRGRHRGQPAHAEEGRLPHSRRACDRAQEVRPEEGPQGPPVLQALTLRHLTGASVEAGAVHVG